MREYKSVGYTKRHMQDLAKILKDVKAEITNIPDATAETAIKLIQQQIEQILSQNPRFNIVKFREAAE